MSLKDFRKRLHTLESKHTCSKVFFNPEHKKDEEIALYEQEHPGADVFVIEVRRAKASIQSHTEVLIKK